MKSLIGLKNMLIFSAVLLTIGSVSAQQAFAVEGQGILYATEPLNRELWTIDPTNGDATLIGPTNDGQNNIKLPSLAVHPITGVMYAGGGSGFTNLYIVDPSNGDLTFVGFTGGGNLVGLDFSSGGTLYAAVKSTSGGGTELGIVNIATGDTQIVGSFGVALRSLAFFGGTLYGVGYTNELYTINTSNGAANLIQNVSPSIDLSASQFACDGTYYVGEGDEHDDFGTLDITNGDFTLIANTDLDEAIGGFAFSQTCGQIISQEVGIDIKPRSDPNSINTRSMGLVPVAILGTESFDVTTVDVTTLMFGNTSPTHDLSDSDTYNEHIQDVNEDGFDDLVSHYKQKDIGIGCGDTEATLTGVLLDGTPIDGTDSVNPKCHP